MDLSPFDRALRKIPAIAAGTLIDDRVGYAGLGSIAGESAPEDLIWEIGSITKVFTAILLAEMALRGEVRLDDPIGRHLPADVAARLPAIELQPTLTDLATHTSGLPRLPWSWVRTIRGSADPYSRLTEQDVWDALGSKAKRPRNPKPHYSNFGVGLLGHLLGRAAGTTYEALVMDRVITPLGMTQTGIGINPVVPGFRKNKPTPPWTFGAVAAAGALRSTSADMITFARAVIDPPTGRLGEAIDLTRQPAWKGRIASAGLGWQIRVRRPGQPAGDTVWHNGGTYGGASFLAVDPSRRKAVVTLGNRGPRLVSPLDAAGWRLFDAIGS